jgi:hypothetical protein
VVVDLNDYRKKKFRVQYIKALIACYGCMQTREAQLHKTRRSNQ